MADFDDATERTESPTPKKRKEAREKGQVARSQEVNSLVILTVGTIILVTCYPLMVHRMERLFIAFFRMSPGVVEVWNAERFSWFLLRTFVPIVAPLFVGVMAAGLAVNVGQVGFHVSIDAITPKLDRIDPVSGLKRLISWRSVFEALKSFVKIVILSLVVYRAFRPSITAIMSLTVQENPPVLGTIARVGLGLTVRALIVVAIVAVLDYAFQFWQHEKSIRMSIKELRDELKETEGDPLVRERVRSIQREIARRRMLEAVKTADVVVTNPTTLAVALKYEPTLRAPRVVAKGRKYLAEKIRRIAEEARVPIVENRPLAWALYQSCKVGGTIPVHLYRAVAEILAYVYSLRARRTP